MASSKCLLQRSKREAAFEAFKAEFVRNGFAVPEGLVSLLRQFSLKSEETPEEGRARSYRRLWCILWHGSKHTLGAQGIVGQPTYVYPATLKRVVREIVPGQVHDKPDPTHARVYKVNIGDLAAAKWPATKVKKSKSFSLRRTQI